MRVTQPDIEAIEYPPTHTYRLDGLEPTGILKERLEILDRAAPGFFDHAERYLDVGASKGFFTRLTKATAVEPDEQCARLLRPITKVVSSIHELTEPFDRVWIGNAHHYLFIEYGGWSWIDKIASLCTRELLIEGPDGMNCPDMNCIPSRLRSIFTRPIWIGSLLAWFEILSESSSVSYTPGRFIWHCRKRETRLTFGERVLVPLYRAMAEYIRPHETVLEIGVRDDRGVLSRKMFNCAKFTSADKDRDRAGLVLDALTDEIPQHDIIVTTALFHHAKSRSLLMSKLCRAARRMVLLSGPDVRLQPELYGDHLWHLDVSVLKQLAADNGFQLRHESLVGTGDVFLAFERA